MPRNRPATTGYERLAQADQLDTDSEDDDPLAASSASFQPSSSAPRFAPITTAPARARSGMTSPKSLQGGHRPSFRRRVGSNSGVDIKAINARLERWADEIASRFKRGRSKSQGQEDERLEIHHSVFQAPEGVRPVTAGEAAEGAEGYMRRQEFESIVESVRLAISQEVHPSMISQGSSGSYFARDPDGKIVGVFKPKDEEPYAAGNPKWNKWIHRNLFPCFFGRACLIPNLSYVSEAAAYVLDCQLQTHLVPYTDVVYLSSKSFHYPFWDRRRYRKKKRALPEKPGSFQVFLKGFKDANVFLREHPWPDQYWAGFRASDSNGGANRRRGKKRRGRWTENCRPTSSASLDGADYSDDEDGHPGQAGEAPAPERFMWNEPLKQSFREELEKLVILDYIMRNTDRGLDNWMVKVDWEAGKVSIASEPVRMNTDAAQTDEAELAPRPVDSSRATSPALRAPNPYKTQKPMNATYTKPKGADPIMSLGAIDNSLSWPWKHPDAWRSFPFGWLFLPVDLIGRPFSQKTRDHFLPLLTSTAWWAQTQMALKRVFQMDADFEERMFAKQIAVMKGQAWNVVEALKSPDHGPLELTRRTKVCVWDDLVDVPVAVPMRAGTSSEIRRSMDQQQQQQPRQSMDEEADIASSAPVDHRVKVDDLLGLTTPPADMPHPGRFEISNPMDDLAESPEEDVASLSRPDIAAKRLHASYQGPARVGLSNTYDPPRQLGHSKEQSQQQQRAQQRRYSFATAAARRSSNSIAQQLAYDYDEDGDLEGDLGYTAAQGQMGHQRKVIVERLEAVKSRNPVFTWC